MARAPKASADAAPVTEAAVAAAPAGETPRYIRLTGIAARSGGKTLPIDTALEIGVDIPASLADARLAEGSAEVVLPSSITATALREVLASAADKARLVIADLLARAAAAGDADLLELVEGFRPGEGFEAEMGRFQDAVRDHAAALTLDASAPEPDPGAEPGGA